nr:MAG TPA: hypothetical protein [Caudoviricetes sp.]DAR50915.1 MAG TPA: hypothetical protein [Caudoviricetes sp.]
MLRTLHIGGITHIVRMFLEVLFKNVYSILVAN